MHARSQLVWLAAVLALVLASGIYVRRQTTVPNTAPAPDVATPAVSDLIPPGPAAESALRSGSLEPEQIAPPDESESASSELSMPEAIFVWACQDPHAAAAWVQALPDGEVKENAWESLAKGWATVSPRDALDFATEVGGRLGEKLTAIVASSWARRDLSAAHEWIASVSEGPLRTAAVLAVTDYLARRDPARSVGWLEQLANGEGRDAGLPQAVSAWAKIDPAAALSWAENAEVSDASVQHELVFSALAELISHDVEKAANWANMLPPAPERDEVVSMLAQGIMENHPEEALLWAATMQDEEARRLESSSILEYWLQSDSNAARTNLPEMMNAWPFVANTAARQELAEIFLQAEAHHSTLLY